MHHLIQITCLMLHYMSDALVGMVGLAETFDLSGHMLQSQGTGTYYLFKFVYQRLNKRQGCKLQDTKLKKQEKHFFLMMRALRIFSNSFHIQNTTVLIVFIMLYVTSLVFIYLVTGSLQYLLTAFIQFLLSRSPISGSHKSDLFFYVCLFVCLFLKYN